MSAEKNAFVVCGEKIEGKGEDSQVMSCKSDLSVMGVFDGCGGSGSSEYVEYDGKTGAYLSSKKTAESVCEWFTEYDTKDIISEKLLSKDIKSIIDKNIGELKNSVENHAQIISRMVKDFPTTAAVMVSSPADEKTMLHFLWAGDSRGYIFNKSGIHQITKDDVSNMDALENLMNEARMNNIISASEEYVLHERVLRVKGKFVGIVASDGCFGYYRSPMAFEYMLLKTLSEAEDMDGWQENIKKEIERVTGDDYSLCIRIFGFTGYEELIEYFKCRQKHMYEKYILPMEQDNTSINELWDEYKEDYERYIGD